MTKQHIFSDDETLLSKEEIQIGGDGMEEGGQSKKIQRVTASKEPVPSGLQDVVVP